MYSSGRGVDKDFAEAATWFRKAAEQGFATAQFNLGSLYYSALGVRKDDVEALKWISIAAQARSDNQAQILVQRDKVAAAMTPDQVAEAQKRADNWLKAFATPTGPTGQPLAPVLRIIEWSSLMGCEYLRGRR